MDLSKLHKEYYRSSLIPDLKDFDTYYYLTIEGQSTHENTLFLQAMEAIYTVAYGIKFICKGEDDDFVVPKMECHWFIDGPLEKQSQFINSPRNLWRWKILLRMPDFVETHHFFRSMDNNQNKNPSLKETINQVKYELINEGKCVQIMHIGSWENEQNSLRKIYDFIEKENLKITGYHKEIYISDPRKTIEDKKKTILRYQVK